MSTIEFNHLLLTNSEFLKPFAITLTRDHELAKDLIQETVYKALINKEKYAVGTNIKAWLYTIMRNIFINDYRKKAKQKTVFDNTPNDFLLNHAGGSVVNTAEGELNRKDINAILYSIPGIFRSPFLLYFEGYKYHEIAEILNEPLGTIKSRIHFARKLVKEHYTRF